MAESASHTPDPYLDNPPNDPEHGTHHIIPVSVYVKVIIALMVLLIITLWAASFNLGEWNLAIAVSIAVAKAVIVLLYFMHLRWSTRLVHVFAGSAFVWLVIMFVLTLSDYFSRGW